jgi:hypothetical protein
MKKLLLASTLVVLAYAQQDQGDYQEKSPQGNYQQQAPEQTYEEPMTGTTLIFRDGRVVGMKASGEAELSFGDRRDIRMSKRKAVLRAKASLAKFMGERLKTKEVSEEIVKTLITQNGDSEEKARKTVQTDTEKIENSADQLLKGVVIKSVNINRAEKFVSVEIMTTLKTQKAADGMHNRMNRNLDTTNSNSGYKNGNQNAEGNTYRHIQNEDMYY